jgi:cytochrome bd ubiquinol oxidase subunit II
MTTADAVAAVLWTGVTAYAVFGGADFGAGFWSLFAGRGERGRRVRALADWAIGPIWEANHVWLIFVLVVLWTAFSSAFAAVFSTLFIPLSLAPWASCCAARASPSTRPRAGRAAAPSPRSCSAPRRC